MASKKTPAVRAAEAAGIRFRLLEYDYDPEAEAVGLQAAEAMGIAPARVFKTLVCVLDGGEMVCAAIPSDARLSLKALAAAAGAKRAEMSDPAKAERATGFVVGGISPFGQRKRLRCFLDSSAQKHDEIVVNGGRRGLQIAAAPAELTRALDAVVCPLQAE
ncbi:Cys-tRNA(Pro) deacylase [Paracraurococcus lichenis]|uniref:Cys-tRNA(Pro)/Cys-tRNA(Cys) deacylase n=1 Tax=Paracraurococcus lichenis TaxID=3064888 RepID=A0ABT9E5C9_9PROT|nr:Cys-tRNA(Pro) deacylase [Paracraurococcus sp. LOR1-02]MDO9711377.1 Cys-tRNA(Pro) deacylase [Paracraurococcus sp. LOR1-02]